MDKHMKVYHVEVRELSELEIAIRDSEPIVFDEFGFADFTWFEIDSCCLAVEKHNKNKWNTRQRKQNKFKYK